MNGRADLLLTVAARINCRRLLRLLDRDFHVHILDPETTVATIVLSDERDWVSGSLGDVVATHFRINSTQVMLKA